MIQPRHRTPAAPATPEELAKYKARAAQYKLLADHLSHFAGGLSVGNPDPQVAAAARTYALECLDTATRWENETEGGL